MVKLRTPNPAPAKKVWESMLNASTRPVARKLRQAGAGISYMTVARLGGGAKDGIHWSGSSGTPSKPPARTSMTPCRC